MKQNMEKEYEIQQIKERIRENQAEIEYYLNMVSVRRGRLEFLSKMLNDVENR